MFKVSSSRCVATEVPVESADPDGQSPATLARRGVIDPELDASLSESGSGTIVTILPVRRSVGGFARGTADDAAEMLVDTVLGTISNGYCDGRRESGRRFRDDIM